MGLFLSRLYSVFESFSSETPARILMLGLDAAGKCGFIDTCICTCILWDSPEFNQIKFFISE